MTVRCSQLALTCRYRSSSGRTDGATPVTSMPERGAWASGAPPCTIAHASRAAATRSRMARILLFPEDAERFPEQHVPRREDADDHDQDGGRDRPGEVDPGLKVPGQRPVSVIAHRPR